MIQVLILFLSVYYYLSDFKLYLVYMQMFENIGT